MSGREFDIIEKYFASYISYKPSQVLLGPGDDCALLDVPEGQELSVSTDTLIEGVHFPFGSTANIVAHRSLCANLSDLAAMGACPFAFTLALTIPSEDDNWLEEFSATLGRLVGKYDIPLVGGNLARGPLSITLTVMGTAPKGTSIRRSGARVSDRVYVTGTLGDAAGGLRMLARDKQATGHLVDRYYYPSPRLEAGLALRGMVSSAIDISDGLMADLGHVCQASATGARIVVDDLPLSTALTNGFSLEEARDLALAAGDDYELCFTAPANVADRISAVARASGIIVTDIGEITDNGGVVLVDRAGHSVSVKDKGYQHFHDA
ncbi:MAG: thiamine-phosphate kinase [Pseudomonadales bacterium]